MRIDIASAVRITLIAAAFSMFSAQSTPTHDISEVEQATPGGAIAVPLPPQQERQLRQYEIPELVGARQALGSQLIDGRLPRPLVDFSATNAAVHQRISLFEGGLVVVSMRGAGGTIRKKLIIPSDALGAYRRNIDPLKLSAVDQLSLPSATGTASALLRVYADDGKFVERRFDPTAAIPKPLQDEVLPLQDLLRSISEDRTVSNSVAGYEPKVGDRLVGDDKKVWRVERVVAESGIVVLRCTDEPTTIYVGKKDLYNYFIGAAPPAAH